MRAMTLPEGIDVDRFRRLAALAREEDFGAAGDITTALLPAARQTARGTWNIVARRAGRYCGTAILPALLEELAPLVRVEPDSAARDGAAVEPGTAVARLSGPLVQMLAAERVLLNFLQRLSGIATVTREVVEAVARTPAKIYDTRKTTPGLRDLEKYAVRVGGGHNHRVGLHDAVLIKDNHLAGVPTERLAHAVFEMLCGWSQPERRPRFVEVEADSVAAARELFKVVGINVILLDNFGPDALREAVSVRDGAGLRGKVELEASGGVTRDNVRRIAETGVERIAVGSLTHSAAALDLGLDAVDSPS